MGKYPVQSIAQPEAPVESRIGNAIHIESVLPSVESVAQVVDRQINGLGFRPHSGEVWAIKLNLTYPEYLPGVVNSPVFVEGLCRWANDCGVKLNFVEGDGGNGSYSAQDTFHGNRVTEIAARYGMCTTSLSEKPWDWRETEVAGKIVRLPYSPFFARREYHRFITTPLFKNHIFTIVSLGMKNLWGCIPDAYRMYYHHVLDHGIVALFKELHPDFSIFDGIIALRGRGPMDGKPIAFNAIMTSETVGVGESGALHIMGIPMPQVRHVWLAHQIGIVPAASQLVWHSDPTPFVRSDFQIQRSLLNHASIILGRFPRLQRWIYHSDLSRWIYPIVDRLRPDSAQAKLVRAKRDRRHSIVRFEDR